MPVLFLIFCPDSISVPMSISTLTRETLGAILQKEVKSLKIEVIAEGLTVSEKLQRLSLCINEKDGQEKLLNIVLKSTQDSSLSFSQQVGLAREAVFYTHYRGSVLAKDFPTIHYAEGNMETGKEMILMEDLSNGVQSGYFFGPGNPMNWGKNLSALTSGEPDLTSHMIAKRAFLLAARIHAFHWKQPEILDIAWLRGSSWARGEGKESWERAQREAAQAWQGVKQSIAKGERPIRWSTQLLAIMDASVGCWSWQQHLDEISRRHWTLVHGDFHPGNMIWCRPDPVCDDAQALTLGADQRALPEGRLVLIDWEVVGVGSGPQDLAQYLISHTPPEERRATELGLVREYYAALLGDLASRDGGSCIDYPWEECWKDYVTGGVGRWVWLLVYIACMPTVPAEAVQYFHDQLLAFVSDHAVNPATVSMPRV
jgi:hypothetical protein